MDKYAGNDNYGRPKADYLAKLGDMSESQLYSECCGMIYQAARCANNPRADWHWKADACYDEAKKRNPEAEIYTRAWNRCYRDHAA